MTSYTSGGTGGASWIQTSGNTWSGTVGASGGGGGGGGGRGSSASWRPVIAGAVQACFDKGCQAPELAALCRQLSEQERELLNTLQRKEEQMEPTRALWCEQTGHAFSEKDPDYQVLSITGKDKDGKQVTESRTICGPCAVQTRTTLGSAQNVPVTELPA